MNSPVAMQEFVSFMERYVQYLESMISGEKEKLAALLSNDLKRIDQSVAAQQAVAMQVETLEKKRILLQGEAGFGRMSFGELVEKADPQERPVLSGLLSRMERAAGEIRYYNDKSMDIVRMNLQRFGSAPLTPTPSGYGAAYQNQSLYEKKV